MARLVSNDKILEYFDECRDSATMWAQHLNTERCVAFYNGDTMAFEDKIEFKSADGGLKRASISIGKIKPYVDAVAGFITQNRGEAKYLSFNYKGDTVASDLYFNTIHKQVRTNNNSESVENDAILDLCVNGYGATDCDITYTDGYATSEAGGDIQKFRIPPQDIWWDTNAKEKNLADRRWSIYRKEYYRRDAERLFRNASEEDFSSDFLNFGLDDSQTWEYVGAKKKDLVNIYNFQWFEYEDYFRAENPLLAIDDEALKQELYDKMVVISEGQQGNGLEDLKVLDQFTFKPTDSILTFGVDIARAMKAELGEYLDIKKFTRKVYMTALISGKTVLKKFRNLSQRDFSLQFFTYNFDAHRGIWTGFVNPMMNAQLVRDKAMTEFMFTLALNSKGGVYVEEGAVEDINEFANEYARTDAIIQVKKGAMSGGGIVDRSRPDLPNGLLQLLQITDQDIVDSGGINKDFLGGIDREESGVMFRRRMRQVSNIIARPKDSVTLYAKLDAKVMIDFIRAWVQNNQDVTIPVIDGDGRVQDFLLSETFLAPDYKIMIKEIGSSAEEEEETSVFFRQLGDTYLGIGDVTVGKGMHRLSLETLPLDIDKKRSAMMLLDDQEQEAIDPAMVEQIQLENQQLKEALQMAISEREQVQAAKTVAETQLIQAKIEREQVLNEVSIADIKKTIQESIRMAIESEAIGRADTVHVNV